MKIIIPLMFVSTIAFADSHSRRIDSTVVRAMGGVSIASETPAGIVKDDKTFSFVVMGIDINGSLSSGIAAYGWLKDVMEFKSNIDLSNIVDEENKLISLASRIPSTFDIQTRLDIVKFQFGNRNVGKFIIGAYAEGFAGVRLSMPSVSDVKVIDNYIDITNPITMVSALGLGDAGVKIGYGRVFNLPHNMNISAGMQIRVFHRWLVRPYYINVDSKIFGEDNFHIPDFSMDTGFGGDVDFSSIFSLNDKVLNTKISFEINSLGAVKYISAVERETINFALGVLINPLAIINFKRWDVGVELHAFEDGKSSLHIGSSIGWGNRWINFSPRIGGAIGDRAVFGETRNIFTAGFSVMLGVLQIGSDIELYKNGYNAGLKLAFGN